MRRYLALLMLVVGGGCTTMSGGTSGGGSSYPEFSRFLTATPDQGARPGGGDAVLRVRWRRLLTEPALMEYKPQEFAGATSDGTRVFVGARGGHFWALAPKSGDVYWRAAISGGVSGKPLYVAEQKAVFIGGADGGLHAFDATTGKERWVYKTKGPVSGTPVYDDGLVLFTNGENRLYAVDAKSGEWKWQYEREAPDTSFTIRGFGDPLAFGGRVYAGFSDGYLVAINAKNGEVIWARSLAGEATRFVDVDSTPVLVDGTLYASSYTGGVHALDPAGGSVKWRYEVEGATTVRVDRGRVYFGATRAGLHCLDGEGRLVWRQALSRQGVLSAPVLVNGRHLLVSASEGGTYIVEPTTGRLEQFFAPGHGVTSEPYSDGRQVYVLTNTGFFYAFSLIS